jgi:hypothetical protein
MPYRRYRRPGIDAVQFPEDPPALALHTGPNRFNAFAGWREDNYLSRWFYIHAENAPLRSPEFGDFAALSPADFQMFTN